ncbi:MAG: hypothetical protein NTX68_21470 [Rhodococcus sp.]|uniref:hypothetical protein n=1 Tax=unclassified Rhodococcus (in: high G+C Gram-positive bacteria) TaxID=192944 RepID=UPI00258742DA|nr:hypothetical protein [Rhodococcus sp. (in: high G+C Gram-positive bacteria)]MCX6493523.1 hypothetical protein [Rhodococcus sp. (in: high G+C Gram-positive bacteria)]
MNVVFPSHVTVHETDVALAGNWTVVAFGPVDHGGVDGIRRALRTTMSIGPAARVGLRPDSGTRRWRYDPDAPLHAVREDSAITEDDYDTAMSQLLATHDPAEPLSITVRGDHVVFYMDHGLGDGQMIINLSHTLADADARNGIVPGWATAAQTRHPLAVAAMRCFGTDPGRVAQLLRSRVLPGISVCGRKHAGGGSAGHGSAQTASTQAAPTAAGSPVEVVAAAATIECTRELARWRDEHRPGQSISILFFAALDAALRAEGLAVDDVAKVLFDVRRYLPPELTTLANLSAGIDVYLPDTTDTVLLSRQWRRIIDCGHPIANLMLVALRSKLARLRSARATDTLPPTAPDTIRLALSDMGRHARLNDIAFVGETQGSYRVMVAPASHGHITLTTARLRDSIRVAASFHSHVVDADTIRRALRAACSTPIAFLEDDASTAAVATNPAA